MPLEQLTHRQQSAILRLESLCDSGNWSYTDLDKDQLPTQEIPPDKFVRHWRVPRETAEFLYTTLIEHKPQHILELGTSTGYSTLWLGAAAATFGGRVDTIDYFGPKIPIAQKFISEAGLLETITQHHSRIMPFLEQSPPCRYDFIFMDADKHNYLRYWKILRPLLSDSFVVVADNAQNGARSMQPFTDYCTNDPTLHCHHIAIGAGLFVINNR